MKHVLIYSIMFIFMMGMVGALELEDNLILYLPLDNYSADMSQYHTGVNVETANKIANGVLNNQYGFNGTTQIEMVTESHELDMMTYNYSVSLWFNMNSRGFILEKGAGSGTRGIRIAISSGYKPYGIIGNDSDYVSCETTSPVNNDKQYHFVVVYNRIGNMDLYLNGVLNNSCDISGITGDVISTNRLSIGRDSSGFNGTIDEVGIWNRTLSESEISYLYNSGNGNHPIGLNYYISNTGNNDNNGTTISTAWKNITRLNSQDIVPLDIISFKRGDSWRGSSYENKLTTDTGAKYGSYGIGEKPLLNRLMVYANNYTTISNLSFQMTDDATSFIMAGSKNITIDNCEFDANRLTHNHNFIIQGWSKSLWVENITVKNSIFKNAGNGVDSVLVNIDVQDYSRNVVFDNCTSFNATDNNYQIYSSSNDKTVAPHNITIRNSIGRNSIVAHGFELGWNVSDCIIEYSYFYDNDAKGGINVGSFNNTIQYNIFYNNSINGQEAGYNNTWIYNTMYDSNNYGFWYSSNESNNTIFRNNIIYGNQGAHPEYRLTTYGSGDLDLDSNYNLFYDDFGTKLEYKAITYTTIFDFNAITGFDANSIIANPLFIDPTNGDFTPARNSPACTMSSTGSYVGALPCSDTCIEGNWSIDLSLNLTYDTGSCNMGGGNLSFVNEGNVTFDIQMSMANMIPPINNQIIYLNSLAVLNITGG